MANGFVNSTDNYQQEEEFDPQEKVVQVQTRKYETEKKVEEKFQVNIFDLLGFIDED
ncbi:hypothetical protein [Ruminococcus albus]|uniref:Uncharacterized protein n=1 Tax=Ruminococcus albus TaxID=1264 RepID=A0A1I1QTV9_RUMAL|nr:hypothetical protein [Ruminococcus albus]SFD25546.1 hypothetical protein SAMN02910406_03511 [Ruminococcus albus]